MSWIYIPEADGAEINKICSENFSLGIPCDCPLWNACQYENDPMKTHEENTRIFEKGMQAALILSKKS